jgi:hypothetical protein
LHDWLEFHRPDASRPRFTRCVCTEIATITALLCLLRLLRYRCSQPWCSSKSSRRSAAAVPNPVPHLDKDPSHCVRAVRHTWQTPLHACIASTLALAHLRARGFPPFCAAVPSAYTPPPHRQAYSPQNHGGAVRKHPRPDLGRYRERVLEGVRTRKCPRREGAGRR